MKDMTKYISSYQGLVETANLRMKMDFLHLLCDSWDDVNFASFLYPILLPYVMHHSVTTPSFKTTAHYLIPTPHCDLSIRYLSNKCIYGETPSSRYHIYIQERLRNDSRAVQILTRNTATYFYHKDIVYGKEIVEKDFVIETPLKYDVLFSRVNGKLYQVVVGNYFYHEEVLFCWEVRSIPLCYDYYVLFVTNAVTGEETFYIVPQHFYRFNMEEKRLIQPFYLQGQLYYVVKAASVTTERRYDNVAHIDPYRDEKWFEDKSEGDYSVVHAASLKIVATIPVSKVYTTKNSIAFVHNNYIHYFCM